MRTVYCIIILIKPGTNAMTQGWYDIIVWQIKIFQMVTISFLHDINRVGRSNIYTIWVYTIVWSIVEKNIYIYLL
jgi:hypothetical protein